MTYNFELDISTKITAENVEAMIKNIVETQTGRKVAAINVRYMDTTFDGYDVRFQQEVTSTVKGVKRDPVMDKTFKMFKWDH